MEQKKAKMRLVAQRFDVAAKEEWDMARLGPRKRDKKPGVDPKLMRIGIQFPNTEMLSGISAAEGVWRDQVRMQHIHGGGSKRVCDGASGFFWAGEIQCA